jgi:hemolysin III
LRISSPEIAAALPFEALGTALPTDGGPVYSETDLTRPIAEPLNAATALAFVALAALWAWRLRGRYRRHRFLVGCLPLLAAGGVGGTLYHAFRRSHALYLLDVIPISLLAVAVSTYLWARMARWWYLILALPAYLAAGALPRVEARHAVINAAYLLLAGLILLPVLLTLRLTRWRGARWVALSLALFAVALALRALDAVTPVPGGTHWLWHLFGAGATAALAEYLYRLGPIEEALIQRGH